MPTGVWFDGETPRTEQGAGFLARLRAEAATSRFTGLETSQTSTWPYLDGQMIEATVPGLTGPRHILRVLYCPAAARNPLLQAELGDDHLFDAEPDNPSHLLVSGVRASAEQCAGWAADWLETQLRRPVVRREWDRPPGRLAAMLPAVDGNIAAVEWWFANPDERVDYRGSLVWWRLMKRPADREVIERPDQRAL